MNTVKKLTAILLVLLAILIAGNCSAAHLSKPGGSNQNSQIRLRTPNNQNGSRVRTGSIIEPVATYNVAQLDSRAELAKVGQMRDIRATVLVCDPVSGWCWQYEVPAIEDGAELGKTFFMEGFVIVAIGDKARATVLHGCRRIGEVMQASGQSGWRYQLDKMGKEDISKRLIEAVAKFVAESDRGEGLFWFEASRVFDANGSQATVRTTTPIQPAQKEIRTTSQLQDGLATVNDFLRIAQQFRR